MSFLLRGKASYIKQHSKTGQWHSPNSALQNKTTVHQTNKQIKLVDLDVVLETDLESKHWAKAKKKRTENLKLAWARKSQTEGWMGNRARTGVYKPERSWG